MPWWKKKSLMHQVISIGGKSAAWALLVTLTQCCEKVCPLNSLHQFFCLVFVPNISDHKRYQRKSKIVIFKQNLIDQSYPNVKYFVRNSYPQNLISGFICHQHLAVFYKAPQQFWPTLLWTVFLRNSTANRFKSRIGLHHSKTLM